MIDTETTVKDNELHHMKTECKNLLINSCFFNLQIVQKPAMETSDDPEDEFNCGRSPNV